MIRKLQFNERNNLTHLFHNPTSAIILSALYTDIGETWISDNQATQTGILYVGNTFYLGGQYMDQEIADFIMEQFFRKDLSQCYIIPQDQAMFTYFDQHFHPPSDGYCIRKSERHLMDLDMKHINHSRLADFIMELPSKYQLKPINEELYHIARNNNNYLNNFVQLYQTYLEFERDGFGFFLLDGSEIIAGISSYARYANGVEVQIAVKPEYQGQHLARSLGAKFILECKKRELYPWWDCANPISEHISVQLGYVLKQVTPIFKCTLYSRKYKSI